MTNASPIKIACDPISNYKRGRKYCIIKNIKTDNASQFIYERTFFPAVKTELLFNNCSLYSIPMGIFEAFPKIKTIYTWNSGIKSIKKANFLNASHLITMDLSQNDLQHLDDYLFFWASSLNYLDLSLNKIETIEKLCFHGLIRLTVLYLHENQIGNIATGTFDNMPNLQILYLNRNLIKTINEHLFMGNGNLLNLYLNDNRIQQIHGNPFTHLKLLENFNVNHNPIKRNEPILVDAKYVNFKNTSIVGCYIGPETRKIFGSHNQIELVIISSRNKTELIELDLSHNKLMSVKNLTVLSKLEVLDLSFNNITDIGIETFSYMANLRILKLRNSGLSSVSFGVFSHQNVLHELDISDNNLVKIDFNMYAAVTNLRTLNLEGNNITEVNMSELRKFFPSLLKIGIAKNQWKCANLAAAIKILESNGIEILSIGRTKNSTNIKGIPCLDDTTENRIELYDSDVESENSELLEIVEEEINENNKCQVSLTSAKEMSIIVKLMELKYGLENFSHEIDKILITFKGNENSNE